MSHRISEYLENANNTINTVHYTKHKHRLSCLSQRKKISLCCTRPWDEINMADQNEATVESQAVNSNDDEPLVSPRWVK